MSVTFTTAQQEDITEILGMMADFYAIDSYPFDADINRKNLTHFMENPALGRLYVIRDGAKTIGYIILTFGFSFEYWGRDAFIDEFYLKPAYRAKGIGSKTMKFVEQVALQLEVKALHLEAENHNERANQLYLRQGFTGNNRSLLTKMINTIGIQQANKVMHLSAMAYNLKKYLKFVEKRVESGVGTTFSTFHIKDLVLRLITADVRPSNLTLPNLYCKQIHPEKSAIRVVFLKIYCVVQRLPLLWCRFLYNDYFR